MTHATKDQRPLRLPLIIPFVLYHGQQDWKLSRQFADFVAMPDGLHAVLSAFVPRFEHALVDLHRIPMEQIRGTAEVRLALGLLKAVSEGLEEQWIEQVFLPAMNILTQTEAAGFLRALLLYLARSSQTMTASTLRQIVDRIPSEKTRSDVMTLAEQLKEVGRQEGMLQARRTAIADVLEARFGMLTPEVQLRLAALTNDSELARALRTAVEARSLSMFLERL